MAAMTTGTVLGLPIGRPLTVDDLETMPDDGHRYELLDGTLLVSPAPGFPHQSVQAELHIALYNACPEHLYVMLAPFAVQFSPVTELQPDILIAELREFTTKNLPTAPLLAVEIRSPSTALIDRTLKRAAYARHGVPHYWIVDPDPEAPSITILELRGEDYVETQSAHGEEDLRIADPFHVRLRPSDLVVRIPDAD
jgi:Uma2 family endonuclease